MEIFLMQKLRQKILAKVESPQYFKANYHYVKKSGNNSTVIYNSDTNFRIEKNTYGYPDINNSKIAWQPCSKREFEFHATEVMRKTQEGLCD